MLTEAHVVLCTAPSADEASRLARGLLDDHLAACVNVVSPIRSFYRWEGEIHDDEEHLLVIKTAADRTPALVDHLRAHHPYDVPEVIALPIEHGSADYLRWVIGETRPKPADAG